MANFKNRISQSKEFPKISVLMATHNREKFVAESIESILSQTFRDFEFIIIDDASTDKTLSIIEKYAKKDKRIQMYKNKENLGLIKTLNKGLSLATGEYIARMDDDDISLPERFQKQLDFLQKNADVIVVGTYVKMFPFGEWPLNISDPDELAIILNFNNCISHPSVMIRKKFLDDNKLLYDEKAIHAEDYCLWKDILLKGGKISNIPEPLIKMRNHHNRISVNNQTSRIMEINAQKIKQELLGRFFRGQELDDIILKTQNFPKCDEKTFLKIINLFKNFPNIIHPKGIKKFQERFLGIPSEINIFFTPNNRYSQHVAVAITSILVNSLPFEKFNFYILDGDITNSNKEKILKCKKIKDCNIEFIPFDETLFEECPQTKECSRIPKYTYYRYIVPLLKPNLKKCLYLDCDIIVEGSLNGLWNTPFNGAYLIAVEDTWIDAHAHYVSLGIKKSFNAGILLINVPLWNQYNTTKLLFENTKMLSDNHLLKWMDQDVLNYTLKGKVKFIHPKYNLQNSAFVGTQHSLYSDDEMYDAIHRPIIIHFSGEMKPWDKKCQHPLKKRYFKILKQSPYKLSYRKYSLKKHFNNFFKFFFKVENVITSSFHKKKFKIFNLTIISSKYANYNYSIKILGIVCYHKFNWAHYFSDKFDYLYYCLNQLQKK